MIVGSNILAGASGQQGYFLNRSVRLRSSASAYFNRTPSSTSNQTIWTYSSWLKRGILNVTPFLLSAADASGSTNYDAIDLSGDTLRIYFNGGSSAYLQTTSVYRDPSSWYHIVVSVDTTQATSSNRIKVYINGVQVTAFGTATYPTQNYASFFNLSGRKNTIGANALTTPANFIDGYFTEINFIDGQALTPTSFGEYNTITGVWQPKKYGGTYGTNGFYLNFNDNSAATAAAIGKDSSGNGNNWTPNNISVTAGVTYDSMTDVPTLTSPTTANYPVLNAVSAYTGLPITNANLQTTAIASGANWFSRSATMGISTGKIYAEFSMPSITSGGQGNPVGFGIMPSTVDFSAIGQQIGGSGYGYGFYCPDTTGSTPKKIVAGTVTSVGTGSATATTDIFMVAFDLTSGNAWFGKNGTWYAGDPSAGTGASITSITAGEYIFGLSIYRDNTYTNNTAAINFGQRPFSYTPPTGFKALNTYNLPTPTIANGGKYMAATLYTGTNGVAGSVTGVGFQPDFVWGKRRGTGSHGLFDSVRGVQKWLASDLTNAESTSSAFLTSFNSDGFSYGTSSLLSEGNIVAWQWKASNAAAVTNTSGSISSQVSANPTAGFSIVTYTGTGAVGTVGHGLGVTPRFMIIKTRSNSDNWYAYHASIGNTGAVFPNLTNATITNSGYWNNTSPTSSVFTVGTIPSQNTWTYVAYCFSEIAGYSKFGSYIGNASTNGAFIYTGFRPRFLMIKNTSSADDWVMIDTSRATYNVAQYSLSANTSAAESSPSYLDILSNGFKIRQTYSQVNANGSTYIYMAFAENPFSYSLAR
jgi:hypothetical protein